MSDTPHSDTYARLIYMANQIARNFCALDHDAAAAATADHIAQFWDPRMKAAISGEEAALSPVAARAFAILKEAGAAACYDVDETSRFDAG